MGILYDYFNRPAWLLLLLLLPLLWWLSYRSLSGLGRVRRFVALGLRTSVLVLLILALAEMQYLRKSERMTVIFLVDQSASIPQAQRTAMIDYVKQTVSTYRDTRQRDRAALIVFGRNANIEVPPLDADLPIIGELETLFDLRTDATNLAAAMKLAQATFPEDSSRRVVLITDGNENLGDARAMARMLAQDGVGLDVVPVLLGDQPEVAVERVTLPSDIRKGQPFAARVVVNNLTPPSAAGPGTVPGTMRLVRRMGRELETLSEQPVELQPGKNVFSFENEIAQPDFYEYEAIFVPAEAEADTLSENNRATAFTHVLGPGHVLLIEDWAHPGQFDHLIQRLRAMDLQVTVQASNELFTNLADLQRYDTIILANVPRSSGDEAEVTHFSDAQIEALVHNTGQMGCGLIMLGGPESLGAGGWTNTELEKAMPVDFRIHNAKVVPVGALALIMHASEIARGNYWQKRIGEEALKALGSQDYCGVVHWTGSEEWLWGRPHGLLRVGPNRRKMLARISRMTPGDMPDFDPSLRLVAAGFARLQDAATKHLICISDGDPTPASDAVLRQFQQLNVKITTVAVGAHGPAGHQELQRIARVTGGKYYVVQNPQALPRIYQREARRVARPLIEESQIQPIMRPGHEVLAGLDEPPPPIDGFVLTTLKENPLVEVLLVSPKPADERNATLLATWTYGLGRTAVLTTDAGYRWASRWTGWDGYDKLFSQLVRWSMRPTGEQGNFTVATDVEQGKVRVTITALDENDELLNFLNMIGSVVDPEMQTQDLVIRQTAPGRYVGEFETDQPGSYLLSLTPGAGRAPIRTGVSVPYSAEYRDRETNLALLESLAGIEPDGGRPGALVPVSLSPRTRAESPQWNPFRRDLAPSISTRDIWPLLVLVSACIFFADVFVRRVHVQLDWVPPLWQRLRSRLLSRPAPPEPDMRLERLRNRKRQIEGQLDEQRAAARFELSPEQLPDEALPPQDESTPSQRPAVASENQEMTPDQPEEDTYTSRLLKAKKGVWKDRPKE